MSGYKVAGTFLDFVKVLGLLMVPNLAQYTLFFFSRSELGFHCSPCGQTSVELFKQITIKSKNSWTILSSTLNVNELFYTLNCIFKIDIDAILPVRQGNTDSCRFW